MEGSVQGGGRGGDTYIRRIHVQSFVSISCVEKVVMQMSSTYEPGASHDVDGATPTTGNISVTWGDAFFYDSYLTVLRATSTHQCCIRGEELGRGSIWRQREKGFCEYEVGSCYLCRSTQFGGSYLSSF